MNEMSRIVPANLAVRAVMACDVMRLPQAVQASFHHDEMSRPTWLYTNKHGCTRSNGEIGEA
jgi:hypothetical protein